MQKTSCLYENQERKKLFSHGFLPTERGVYVSHVSRQIVVVDPLFGIRHKLQQRGGGSMLEFRQFERSHLSGS